MSDLLSSELPEGWSFARIDKVCDVNPRVNKSEIPDDLLISFVPMPAVGAGDGSMDVSQERPALEVKKGFTAFKEGDVLFAKITPCMENGKMAVVPSVANGYGFGSTEFHVLRPKEGVDARYVYYYVSSQNFRGVAERYMTGAVGQKRVSTTYLKEQKIPLAPPRQQKLIVAEIEKQFSRLDEAVANLKRVKANLKRYKAAVLKAAVEGKLTEEWRKQHPDVEPADKLLERILAERREKWQGRGKYKEPVASDTTGLPVLPKGWVWASPEQISAGEQYSLAIGPFGSNLKVGDYKENGVPLVFVRNIRANYFGPQNAVFVSDEKAEELKAHHVSGGDLLITKMGDPPGDTCIYPEDMPTAVITADCIKLRLSPCLDTASYFHRSIESRVVQKQILGVTKGVAQLKVSLARFKTIALPVPPLDEQRKISEEVERCFSIIARTEAQIDSNLLRADWTRQAILKKAFSGKLMGFK